MEWRWSGDGVEMELGVELELDKKFFQLTDTWKEEGGQEFPDRIDFQGKSYEGPETMKGLEAAAKKQAKKERIGNTN